MHGTTNIKAFSIFTFSYNSWGSQWWIWRSLSSAVWHFAVWKRPKNKYGELILPSSEQNSKLRGKSHVRDTRVVHPHRPIKKVKCTLIQTLQLCTGRTVRRGSRGIALPFHDHCTRRGWGVNVTLRPLFTPGKDPVLIVQEARWAPGQVWTDAENLAPTGIRSPYRPARSQSLYRLRYLAHSPWCRTYKIDWYHYKESKWIP